MEKEQEKIQYISLKDAAQFCNYSQEYLSLRARQGKLRATKIGRNWVTTHVWILEYVDRAEKLEETGVQDNLYPGLHMQPAESEDIRSQPPGAKYVEPPENIPIEEFNPYTKRISASPFSAFKFGAALALLFAFVASGFVFGKEGWYKMAEDVAASVETLGKGFDVGFPKLTFAIATSVQSLGEGFETGTKTVARNATSVTQTFGKGFDAGFENASSLVATQAQSLGERVQTFGKGFDTASANVAGILSLAGHAFGQGFDTGFTALARAIDSEVQFLGQGFDTGIKSLGTSIIPSYVLSLGNGFDTGVLAAAKGISYGVGEFGNGFEVGLKDGFPLAKDRVFSLDLFNHTILYCSHADARAGEDRPGEPQGGSCLPGHSEGKRRRPVRPHLRPDCRECPRSLRRRRGGRLCPPVGKRARETSR